MLTTILIRIRMRAKCYIALLAATLTTMQTSPLADQVFVFTSLSTFLAGAEPDLDFYNSNPTSEFQESHLSCPYNPSLVYQPLVIFRKMYVIFSFLFFFFTNIYCFNKLTIIDQKMILSLKEIQF